MYAVSVMSHSPEHDSPEDTPPRPGPPRPDAGRSTGWGRGGVAVLAFVVASLGLICLMAVLITAFLGGEVWRGFIAGAYIFLPAGFLLMTALLIANVNKRRRS